MATFTEFYCQSTGSNLNAGSTTADAASRTYASGSWVAATGVFTPASGDPSADGVVAGDFASVYADGSTGTGFVGRVTAVSSTTITVSLTARAGTAPTDGTSNRTLKVGGAWQGPTGSSGFPLTLMQVTLTDSAGDRPRVNLKAGTNYAITAAVSMTSSNNGPIVYQGYTTTPGDGGRATIDGGTSGTSYILLTVGASFTTLVDLIFQNNGATGSAGGVSVSGVNNLVQRCAFRTVRAFGLQVSGAGAVIAECEFTGCNQSNSVNQGGLYVLSVVGVAVHGCACRNNSGSNSAGLFVSSSLVVATRCVFSGNGADGARHASSGGLYLNCDFYNNAGDGIDWSTTPGGRPAAAVNCNLVKNGNFGIRGQGLGGGAGLVHNCGFGAGTQVNTSGTTTALNEGTEVGSVTYPTDVTPWVDPANDDFRISLTQARGAGRAVAPPGFTSVGYPDIGAYQHQETGGGGGFRRITTDGGF